jgi:hypothetical protein
MARMLSKLRSRYRPALPGLLSERAQTRGYLPSAIKSFRSITRLSRFSFSTRAVTKPCSVSGSIRALVS